MIASTAADTPRAAGIAHPTDTLADFLGALCAEEDPRQPAADLAALVRARLSVQAGARDELRFAVVEAESDAA